MGAPSLADGKRLLTISSIALAAPLLLVLAIFPGCGEIGFPSRWLASPADAPKLDGDFAEWRDSFYSLQDGTLYAAAANDAGHLTLCLASDNALVLRQVLEGGLTVWFEGRKGSPGLGIRFPLGAPPETSVGRARAADNGERPRPAEGGKEPDSSARSADPWRPFGGDGPDRRLSPDSIRSLVRKLNASDAELEILGQEPGRRLPVSRASGLDLHVGWKEGTLVYELRLPLMRDEEHPYAVGARPGEEVALRLETPKLRSSRQGDGERGGTRGHGPGDRGGARGRGGPDRGELEGRGPRLGSRAAGGFDAFQQAPGEDGDTDEWGRPRSTDGGPPLFPEPQRAGPPARLNLRLKLRLAAPPGK